MEKMVVRIEEIEINNFKNVINGRISLNNGKTQSKASVLGLYGQNGSGKTALIDALSLLKYALTGKSIKSKYADYINVDKEYANFKYKLSVNFPEEKIVYNVIYEFCIRKRIKINQNVDTSKEESNEVVTEIYDEILRYSYKNGESSVSLQKLIDTSVSNVSTNAFTPSSKYNDLVFNDTIDKKVRKDISQKLMIAKIIAHNESRSFIFSRELLNTIKENCKAKEYVILLNSLVYYGNSSLFIFNTTSSGLISLNALPLGVKYEGDGKGIIGNLMIKLNGPTPIPRDSLEMVREVIESMNIVLNELIPGLKIGIKDLGPSTTNDAGIIHNVQLLSFKNNKEIPICNESEGIKKIISILQLLIVVFNQMNITVAIDELDAGIFEYLLGEILRIVTEKGKGQLIFTSHNLRPLETIDKNFVAFTTTNPENRYIRFANVQTNHNLRDFYYRDIVLGEQEEDVYEYTNNGAITLAFREAGAYIGS